MLTLRQIPVWTDNYAYLLSHDQQAIVVDAPEAGPVLEAAKAADVEIVAVLNTHHHPDHVGANPALVAKTGCKVFGPAHDRERIVGITDDAVVGVPLHVAGLTFRVLDVRAHTMGHIAYALEAPCDVVIRHGHAGEATRSPELEHRPTLFVGDSLFAGGCGRLFEGTPFDLEAAMRTLDAEDERALVVCAHEYTASNLRFAQSVSAGPDVDLLIRARAAGLAAAKGASQSSVPSVLELERETNPFLLALREEVREVYAKALDVDTMPASVLGALRAAKDAFR